MCGFHSKSEFKFFEKNTRARKGMKRVGKKYQKVKRLPFHEIKNLFIGSSIAHTGNLSACKALEVNTND